MFFALIMLACIASCEEREDLVVEPSGAAIVMDLSAENLVLDENFPSNPALTITWEPSSYSVPVEVKYSLEISSTENFATPYVLTTTLQSITNASFSMKEMNDAAKKIGLVPYEVQKMYFRVSSYLGTNNSLLQKSQVTNLNITPYVSSPVYEYQDLFIIGEAAIGNWDNNISNMTLIPLLKTANPSQYTFTGFFKEKNAAMETAGFKMIKVKGSWEAQFGKGAASGQLSTDGGSANLSVPTDGYYKLTVDTAALTYTLESVPAPTATYTSMSIIGTVNGNDFVTDRQLTQSTFDPHLWYISGAELLAGEFKFRANNSWDNNWGTNAEYFGTATKGGSNIPLSSEWTYDIYFNDATGDYTIIPVE